MYRSTSYYAGYCTCSLLASFTVIWSCVGPTTTPGFSYFGFILCCSIFCYGCIFALLCLL